MGFTRLDNKRRLRIPQEAADLLYLEPGDDVAWVVVENKLVIQKVDDPFAAARGYDWAGIAQAVDRAFREQPGQFVTLKQSMARHGITQADLDAVGPEPGIDD